MKTSTTKTKRTYTKRRRYTRRANAATKNMVTIRVPAKQAFALGLILGRATN